MSLEAPSSRGNNTTHADFLELVSLIYGKSSRETLIGVLLRQVDSVETALEEEEAEEQGSGYEDDRARGIADEALDEIELRQNDCHGQYPFQIHRGGVIRPTKWAIQTPYVFMLALSHVGIRRRLKGIYPERHFESICKEAAQKYLAGQGLKFGHPRKGTELPSNFKQAIAKLSLCIGEGDGLKPTHPPIPAKDAELDVVAWRNFYDTRPGKVMIFGQCAAGHDWKEKLTKLTPSAFCEDWFAEQPPVKPVRAFFIPHCIDRRKWVSISRKAGILFDRCRIAGCLGNKRISDQELKWNKCTLESLKNAAA